MPLADMPLSSVLLKLLASPVDSLLTSMRYLPSLLRICAFTSATCPMIAKLTLYLASRLSAFMHIVRNDKDNNKYATLFISNDSNIWIKYVKIS